MSNGKSLNRQLVLLSGLSSVFVVASVSTFRRASISSESGAEVETLCGLCVVVARSLKD